jgi:hypothetical protein
VTGSQPFLGSWQFFLLSVPTPTIVNSKTLHSFQGNICQLQENQLTQI